MSPVRAAVDLPLMALAPSQASVSAPADASVATSLASSSTAQLGFSALYTRASTVTTVHTDDSDDLAPEPLARNAAVSVHVTYLYACGGPVVRALICRSLDSLLGPQTGGLFDMFSLSSNELGKRLELAEDAGALQRLAGAGAYFAVLNAQATLPNQGAAYDHAADQ